MCSRNECHRNLIAVASPDDVSNAGSLGASVSTMLSLFHCEVQRRRAVIPEFGPIIRLDYRRQLGQRSNRGLKLNVQPKSRVVLAADISLRVVSFADCFRVHQRQSRIKECGATQ